MDHELRYGPGPGAHRAQPGAGLSGAIASGDAAALAEFYESRFEAMFALARGLTGRDEAFCLDVVQETMLRVARKARPMASDRDLDRWACRVLKSAALDLLRREKRRARRDAQAGVPNSDAITPDRAELLRKGLASLAPEDALLVTLRFGHDATLEEAGRAVGATGDAVHGRIRRALRKLRDYLMEAAL